MRVTNWVSGLIEDCLDVKLFDELGQVHHIFLVGEYHFFWRDHFLFSVLSTPDHRSLLYSLFLGSIYLFSSFIFLNFDRRVCYDFGWGYSLIRSWRSRPLTSSSSHWLDCLSLDEIKLIEMGIAKEWLWWILGVVLSSYLVTDDKYQSNKYIPLNFCSL